MMSTYYQRKKLLSVCIALLLAATTLMSTDAAATRGSKMTGLIFVSSPGHATMGNGGVRGYKSGGGAVMKSVGFPAKHQDDKHIEVENGKTAASREMKTNSAAGAVVEGEGMAWNVLRWAAQSASAHKAAYIHSLVVRAELFISLTSVTPQTSENQTLENQIISQVLAELKEAVSVWEAAEGQRIDLIFQALQHIAAITQKEMYSSEANVTLAYVEVRDGARILEMLLPNTVAAGISHELSQSIIYKPLAAFVRSIVWVGSVSGLVLLPLVFGLLFGIIVSNREPCWSSVGLWGSVGVLVISMQAVASAVFRCSNVSNGCSLSIFNAYILMYVVRRCLSGKPEKASY